MSKLPPADPKSLTVRASAVLVLASVVLSLATWSVYVGAYLGKVGDEAERPIVLLVFCTPFVAGASVVFTIKIIDIVSRRAWRLQFITAIICGISAVGALLFFFVVV